MNFKKIEQKWQKAWEKNKIFKSKKSNKKKFYALEMYPYPSSTGLHIGHARNYLTGDIQARFKRMQGYNVMHPIGYDSFGLPAENAAIKFKSHPKIFTEKAIKNFTNQLKSLGISYDWDRKIESHNPDYYKWDQWIFLQLLKKGLAYKKESVVNWCPKCNTVLANEQVVNGRCWRHTDTEIKLKNLNQWFFKTTFYTEKLLNDLDKLKQWPEDIKQMQRNWIGKKKWINITYKIDKTNQKITVSTTRPDTNFGATFVVIAPEHKLLQSNIIPKENREKVNKYIEQTLKKSHEERLQGTDKTGVFSGLYCINPLTNKKMPLWVADFVLTNVGTGVVVGVPGHDKRDFDFAKKFKLPIIRVIVPPDGNKSEITKREQVYEDYEGTLINSGFLDGLKIKDALKKVMYHLEKEKIGKSEIRYRLHDWLISRQRAWGCPIPIVYCDKCGIVPIKEKDLPVKLPDKIKFEGKGNPLATTPSFINTKCPKCNGKAKRETDTMDTFIDSSWYFLRYTDPKNNKKIFDSKKANYWLPIDLYIGGREHATGHLIYFRFITKFLNDLGLIKISEPAIKLFNQGMVNKEGKKMSKSLGNVIEPKEVFNKYGVDAARFYMMFVASPDKDLEWSDEGIQGALKAVNKIYSLIDKKITKKEDKLLTNRKNIAIKKITENIKELKYNLALIDLMEYVNYLNNQEQISKSSIETLALLVSPFCPHTAEEIWEKLGNKPFISIAKWPKQGKIDKELEQQEQTIEGVRSDLNNILKLIKTQPKTCYLYTIPKDKSTFKQAIKRLEKIFNLKFKIQAVNDKDIHDPNNKRKKAKPNKPAIYLE